ncbi:geminin coiled-coil domain-containing protein 1 [Leuresthes tenuis]|uniref:geminin coiled-coil domain-containing protein 1 n=1 Tax=Leuresthes tenuis TaxID=355514 RepID=UPI003B50631A
METLASIWAHDPKDLRDLDGKRHEQLPVWDCVSSSSPPAGLMWAQQLSPHLQRNKQLQDTLLQREEELARLQEENIKLREFLSSSFVRNVQQKAKKLTADGRRTLKRKLTDLQDEQSCSHQLLNSRQVSKKVCRNLTAEFCSESPETSACSEPNLDLWVLRTLGLKDRDTIDTSSESSSEYNLRGLFYDAAVAPSSSSEYAPSSSFGSPVASSTPSGCCQRSAQETDYRFLVSEPSNPAQSAQNCSSTTGPTGLCQFPEATPGSYSSAFPNAAFSQVQTGKENPAKQLLHWSPLQGSQSPKEQVLFSLVLSQSPAANQPWTPAAGCSPSAASRPPFTPQTPRSRTDLAFSMSLSPSSSVKTHSFPQGQAFVRKDTEGRWNFTWVPRQEP